MPLLKIKFLIPLIGIGLISCKQNKQPQQANAIAPPVRHKQLPIWTKSIPDSELITGVETYNDGMVRNVSIPTITIYPPKGENTGAAVVVFLVVAGSSLQSQSVQDETPRYHNE